MGPRSLKRGNPYSGKPTVLIPIELQWGHALSSVETRARELTREAARLYASMGPRSLKRGNRAVVPLRIAGRVRFNGATLSQAWKHTRRP